MTNLTPPGGMEPENDINGGSPEEQLSPDELALRRLMRDAVSDIQPGHEALDHLRRAVPARRTHRRQLLAGSAAACLLTLVAVPAALHAANISGSAKTGTANASSARDNGGTDGGPDGPAAGAGTPTPTAGDGVPDEGPTRTSSSQAQVPPGSSNAVDPSDTLAANAPLCSSDDLGEASGYAGASDGAGRVSGWFQVANTSDRSCTVDGGGTVTFAAQGAAESARISVVDHTANDGTTLPDSLGTLILKAGQSYRVEFTWVPAAGGTGGCTPPSTPTPTATATDSPTGEASAPPAGDNGASQGAPAAIVLSHTPEAGAPVVNATIDGACAGTVYKTGAVAAP